MELISDLLVELFLSASTVGGGHSLRVGAFSWNGTVPICGMEFRTYDCCVTYNNWSDATHIFIYRSPAAFVSYISLLCCALSQVDQGGTRCSLTGSGQHTVLASLLAELLFLRGEQCRRMEDLPLLYQQHFGIPLDLSCLGVSSVTDLLQLPEISQVVQVSWGVHSYIMVCII